MSVYLKDFLYSGGFEEGGGNTLFDAEDDTIACCNLALESEKV